MSPPRIPDRELLEAIFRSGLRSVDPATLVRRALAARDALPGDDPVFLAGAGKAGRAMAEAAIRILGARVAAGIVAVPRGQGGRTGTVRFLEAGHPLPDGGSLRAAAGIRRLLGEAGTESRVLALLSGGGSSLLGEPAKGVSLPEKAETVRLLLSAGASIGEINAVRKHLSAVKGGRLALAASPAATTVLLLSDVPGDDPSVVASGPFSPDPTTCADAVRILGERGLLERVPPRVRTHLEGGCGDPSRETPKPGHEAFSRVENRLIGTNGTALAGAKEEARRLGARAVVLPGFLGGEARECALRFVEALRGEGRFLPPGGTAVLLAGGETAVTVRGPGRGGRAQEFALAAALALEGTRGMALLCAGTDGVDGPTGAAGAFADGTTCARARGAGIVPERFLEGNDSHSFFRAVGGLLVTGPTGTNVADLVIGVAY